MTRTTARTHREPDRYEYINKTYTSIYMYTCAGWDDITWTPPDVFIVRK